MSTLTSLGARPTSTSDYKEPSRYRSVGLTMAIIGLMGVAVASVGNFVAASGIGVGDGYQETLAWTFGLSIFAFGFIKLAIAVILVGVIVRLWFRVDSIKEGLTRLRPDTDHPAKTTVPSEIDTEWGAATVTKTPPGPLPIHRLARTMWKPSLLMGAMALFAGFVASFVWADQSVGTESARQAAAFTQGTEFLGETLLLTGIAFLLGTILAGLREGGGEVQRSLGLPVTTLRMPATAKAFVVLMMMGMMAGVAQFVAYLVAIGVADDPDRFSQWMNVLGPVREAALGLILAGIVLALVTIGTILKFQFNRVQSIMHTGS